MARTLPCERHAFEVAVCKTACAANFYIDDLSHGYLRACPEADQAINLPLALVKPLRATATLSTGLDGIKADADFGKIISPCRPLAFR